MVWIGLAPCERDETSRLAGFGSGWQGLRHKHDERVAQAGRHSPLVEASQVPSAARTRPIPPRPGGASILGGGHGHRVSRSQLRALDTPSPCHRDRCSLARRRYYCPAPGCRFFPVSAPNGFTPLRLRLRLCLRLRLRLRLCLRLCCCTAPR